MKKPIFLLILSVGVASAATVTVPYSNSFGSSASDFTTDGGSWALGSGTYNNVISSANTPSSASVQSSSLAGQSFTMSTTFVINSVTGTYAGTIGFGAMGDTSSFVAGSGTNNLLLVDVSLAGSMRFVTLGSSTTSYGTGTFAGGTLTLGTSYNMSLTGIYQPNGSVALTFTLSDGTNTTSINQTLSAAQSPDGTNFGYRNRTNNATAMDVSFDNFNLGVIPEPSSVALALFGLPLAFMRRRK